MSNAANIRMLRALARGADMAQATLQEKLAQTEGTLQSQPVATAALVMIGLAGTFKGAADILEAEEPQLPRETDDKPIHYDPKGRSSK